MTGQAYPTSSIPERMMDSKHSKPQKTGLPTYVSRWKDFVREIDSNILFKLGVDKPMTGCRATLRAVAELLFPAKS